MKIWTPIVTNIYLRHFILACIIFACIVVGILWWLDIYTRHNEAITVPELNGLSIEEVAPLLSSRTLQYVVVDSVFNKNFAPGKIVSSVPSGGSKVKQGRTIYITLNSRGDRIISLPEVRDLSQRQALSMLTSLGLVNVQVEYVSGAYVDLVTGLIYNNEEVSLGDKVPSNALLYLRVSMGDVDPNETAPSEELDNDNNDILDENFF
ncbi:PASTA domain-containing protein [Bacteroidales bacterium]|nr:PASTA domain-containing protein [Bacteroidales bacterium]